MALPFTFGSELFFGFDRNSTQGPWVNGTDLYLVACDTVAFTLEVWRSTDGGNSWSEQDAANHKTCENVTGRDNVSVDQDGTTLYIGYSVSPGALAFVSFDMSTNTFGTPVTGGPTLASGQGYTAWQFFHRSDGTFVVLYQGAAETIMGTSYRRVAYRIYSGGAWGSELILAETGVQAVFNARAAVKDTAERIHAIVANTTATSVNSRALTAANVLQSTSAIDSSVIAATSANYFSVGTPWLDGTELLVPYVDLSADLNLGRATEADVPTWSTQVVTTVNDPETNDANCGVAVVAQGKVYVIWPNDADQDVYYDNDGGTGTWGTDVEWKDAITCRAIHARPVPGGIGVFYTDADVLKYDLIAVVAADSFPAGRVRGPRHFIRRRR